MRKLCGTILAAVAALAAHGAFDVRDFGAFDVRDFGAKGDGVANDTAAIQHAIDAAHAAGGGCVVVPKGEWLTCALFFRPGVNLRLEKGATIVGADEADGYPMRETRIEGETCRYYPALINADRCDGFTISGEGVINGHGANTWEEFWTRLAEARKQGVDFRNKDLMRPRVLYGS